MNDETDQEIRPGLIVEQDGEQYQLTHKTDEEPDLWDSINKDNKMSFFTGGEISDDEEVAVVGYQEDKIEERVEFTGGNR